MEQDSERQFLLKQPGAELLSDVELELCARLTIFPYHYLAIKDVLVREAFRNGLLSQAAVKRLLIIDGEKAQTIYDFFVKELRVNESTSRGFRGQDS
jgi:hypothetical protein